MPGGDSSKILGNMLSLPEISLARQCVRAVLEGPWMPSEGELHARTGLWRAEYEAVLAAWPEWAPQEIDVVRSALGEVWGGIRFKDEEYDLWIDRPSDDVRALCRKVDHIAQNWRGPGG